MGDRYRANQAAAEQADDQVRELEMQISELAQAETDLRLHGQALAQLSSRWRSLRCNAGSLVSEGAAPAGRAAAQCWKLRAYAAEARAQLAEIDAELKAIGYDAAAHDRLRQAEAAGRSSEAELRGVGERPRRPGAAGA